MKRPFRPEILLLFVLWTLVALRLAFSAWRFAHAPKDFSFLWAAGFLLFALVLLVRKLTSSRRSR